MSESEPLNEPKSRPSNLITFPGTLNFVADEPSEDALLIGRLEFGSLDESFLDLMEGRPKIPEPDMSGESSLSLYLREISQRPLLSAEDEIELAKQIEDGNLAKEETIIKDILDPEQKRQLNEKIQLGNSARLILTESNLRLVVSVARKYMGRGLPLQDLLQEGNIGLTRGVEKYDWRRGYRFSTYAYWWIRQAVSRSVADQARTVRLPVHVIENLNNLYRAAKELSQEYGRDPTTEEIAGRTGLEVDRVRQLFQAAMVPVSLETPVGEEEDSTLANMIADANADLPPDVAEANNLSETLNEALRTHLTPREAQVLRRRFGLIDGQVRTLGEVGEELDMSRERARQIESEAIRKLRSNLPFIRKFRNYVD